MKQSPNSAQALQTVKREDFRSQMRKEQLERIFSKKRHQKEQLDNTSDDEDTDQSASNQFDSDSSPEEAITRLTRMQTKPVTLKYAQKLLKYVTKNKNQRNSYQLNKVYTFCRDTLLMREIGEESIVPVLIAVLHTTMELNFSEEKFMEVTNFYNTEVVQILLKTFCKKPENTVIGFLERMLQKRPIFTQFLDDSCKEIGVIRNLGEGENLNYAKLQMIKFLFSNIQNTQLIEAFKFLGLQKKLQKCSENPHFAKLVNQINTLTNNV